MFRLPFSVHFQTDVDVFPAAQAFARIPTGHLPLGGSVFRFGGVRISHRRGLHDPHGHHQNKTRHSGHQPTITTTALLR